MRKCECSLVIFKQQTCFILSNVNKAAYSKKNLESLRENLENYKNKRLNLSIRFLLVILGYISGSSKLTLRFQSNICSFRLLVFDISYRWYCRHDITSPGVIRTQHFLFPCSYSSYKVTNFPYNIYLEYMSLRIFI